MTFRHAFFLHGLDAMQPPGDYVVDTDEEPIDGRFGTAYRRVGTWIWLPSAADRSGVVRMASIDARELEAALAVDARQSGAA